MDSQTFAVKTFGFPIAGLTYRPRRAVYAVITSNTGRVAVVGYKGRYFLPGGGAEDGETPEQTLEREVREELARSVRIVRRLGEAIQYFLAEDQPYRMEAVFYVAEFTGEATTAGEHSLHWLAPDEMESACFHPCHVWAARLMDASPIETEDDLNR